MFNKMESLSKISLIVIFLILGLCVGNCISQEPFPSRPITMVCTYGAGGFIDNFSRALARIAEKELGQPIINENKPGAMGTVGTAYVVRSKPDGYTIGITSTSCYIVAPHMRKLPYDTFTDLVDITTFTKMDTGLIVRADAPWKTYQEVLHFARQNPGKFTYACSGIGTIPNITMERIAIKEGIKWTVVPFKAAGEATLSTLGGHTNAVTQGPPDTLSHIKAGKLKMLLALDKTRWPELPDVPSMSDKGYNFSAWAIFTVFGPKGLPEPIRQKLEDVFNRAKKHSSYIELQKKFGARESDMGGAEHSKFIKAEYEAMGKIVKTLGLEEK